MTWGNNNMAQDRITQLFSHYRAENNELITRYKNCIVIMQKLQKLWGKYEKEEVVPSSFFQINKKLESLFDALELRGDRIENLLKDLDKSLVDEKQTLDKYFEKIKHGIIEALVQLEALLINYNKTQYDQVQNLNTMIPNILELYENVLGRTSRKWV